MPEKVSLGHARAERRHYPRLPIAIKMNYQSVAEIEAVEAVESRSENLSLGGLAMRTVQSLPVGQVIRVVLYIPARELRGVDGTPTGAGGDEHVSILVEARVAWCSPEGKSHRVGLEFLRMDPDDEECFQTFVEAYVFTDTDEPSA